MIRAENLHLCLDIAMFTKFEAAAKYISYIPIMRARILPRVHVYSWSMSTHVSRLEVNYENPDDAKKCVNELHGMDTWLISLK